MKTKNEGKKITRITIVFVVIIALFLSYYTFQTNKRREANKDAQMTAVQKVLNRNLEKDYPATPKEVIKYYSEIMKCYYDTKTTDSELDQLGVQARLLFDSELQENNQLATYLINLKSDMKDANKNEVVLSSFTVASSTNVDFFEEDGYSFARLSCRYYFRTSGKSTPSDITYLLRKDDDRHWRIYGWKNTADLED